MKDVYKEKKCLDKQSTVNHYWMIKDVIYDFVKQKCSSNKFDA